MDANKLSSISQSNTNEKIGEFWDSHDFTDFDTEMPDVEFEVICTVPLEIDLFSELEQQARRRGIKVNTLVNLWLRQKLAEQMMV